MGLISTAKLSEIPAKTSDSGGDFDDDGVWVFTLKCESEADVVFLNNGMDIPIVDAVELYTPGNRPVRAAVLSSSGKDCPFTNLLKETGDKKLRPKKFFVFTILDLREVERKNGEIIPYTRKALLVKSHLMDKMVRKRLLKHQEKKGELRGSKWELSRGPDMNPSPPSCGDTWDFTEMVDLKKYSNTDVLTEAEILSLFVTDPGELAKLASDWRPTETVAKAKYD